jgi:hypothetical protein
MILLVNGESLQLNGLNNLEHQIYWMAIWQLLSNYCIDSLDVLWFLKIYWNELSAASLQSKTRFNKFLKTRSNV